jgi:tyrosyl-tRNA synthetase
VQGYDYWQLYKKHKVVLQIGGSDQWGNMLSGVPLIRKKENVQVHAMSMPLVIDKTTGKKFGKSEAGAIWLDESKTSTYDFYQFWLNVSDDAVANFLKVYTLLSLEEIEKVMAEFKGDRASRLAQKTLAFEVTALVHGEDKAKSVAAESEKLFQSRDYSQFTAGDFKRLAAELKEFEVEPNANLMQILTNTSMASSNTEARRFLAEGAVYINGSQVRAEKMTLSENDFVNGYIVLRRGKNTQVLLRCSA